MSDRDKAARYIAARLAGKTDGEACRLAGYEGRPPGYVYRDYLAIARRKMLAARTTHSQPKD